MEIKKINFKIIILYGMLLFSTVIFTHRFVLNTFFISEHKLSYIDFTSYYIAGWQIKNGMSPYTGLEIKENLICNKVSPETLHKMGIDFGIPERFGYTYPPLFAWTIIPIILLIYFVFIRRDYKFVWPFICISIVLFMLCILTVGSKELIYYTTYIIPTLSNSYLLEIHHLIFVLLPLSTVLVYSKFDKIWNKVFILLNMRFKNADF
ncbi:MAG: hypothetical protein ABH873_09590 [Candidatus Firestonebacteria bacterium]